jgi:hypothetical protein
LKTLITQIMAAVATPMPITAMAVMMLMALWLFFEKR